MKKFSKSFKLSRNSHVKRAFPKNSMEEILDQYKNRQAPTPEGYFDSLPDQVLARIAEEDAQMQALLEAHRTNKGYPVPENYFAQLPDAVMAKVATEPSKKLFLQRRWVRIASVAACAGLLMGTGIYVFNMLQSPENLTGEKTAHVKATPPTPAQNTQTALDFDKALAFNNNNPAENNKTATAATQRTPSTDAATDQFIKENLNENDLDEVDFDILDFYSDDMASSDLWDF